MTLTVYICVPEGLVLMGCLFLYIQVIVSLVLYEGKMLFITLVVIFNRKVKKICYCGGVHIKVCTSLPTYRFN